MSNLSVKHSRSLSPAILRFDNLAVWLAPSAKTASVPMQTPRGMAALQQRTRLQSCKRVDTEESPSRGLSSATVFQRKTQENTKWDVGNRSLSRSILLLSCK